MRRILPLLVLGLATAPAALAGEAILGEVVQPQWCERGSHELRYLYQTMGETGSFKAADFGRGDCDPGAGYIADIIYVKDDLLIWQASFTGWMVECSCRNASR